MEIRNRQDFSTTRSKTRHEFSLRSEIVKNLKNLDKTVSCRSHQWNSIAHSYRNRIDRDYELDRNWSTDPFCTTLWIPTTKSPRIRLQFTLVKISKEDASQTAFQRLRNLASACSITNNLRASAVTEQSFAIQRKSLALRFREEASVRPGASTPRVLQAVRS